MRPTHVTAPSTSSASSLDAVAVRVPRLRTSLVNNHAASLGITRTSLRPIGVMCRMPMCCTKATHRVPSRDRTLETPTQ